MQHHNITALTNTRSGVSHKALEAMVFAGMSNGGMNACVACCDRWVDEDGAGLTWFGRDGGQTDRSFAALRADAARFANLLTARGVRPGDVVAGMLPRGAELLTVVLGAWRAGAVFQPISTGFGPRAIEARIHHTGRPAAKLIVTDMDNRAKLDLVEFCPPVLVVTNGAPVEAGDGDFMAELVCQSAFFAPVALDGDAPFILLVGGRAGQMRPVMPALRSLVTVLSSLQMGADPHEAEAGWDVADPAWAAGLYFAVIRPLLMGQAATAYESDRAGVVVEITPPPARIADAARWYQRNECLRLAA